MRKVITLMATLFIASTNCMAQSYADLIKAKKRLYRYCPWMRGMATSQISCNNGIDKKASHVPL